MPVSLEEAKLFVSKTRAEANRLRAALNQVESAVKVVQTHQAAASSAASVVARLERRLAHPQVSPERKVRVGFRLEEARTALEIAAAELESSLSKLELPCR